MGEELAGKESDIMDGSEVPGTAQIRKLTSYKSSMELLKIAAQMATDGYEKKLFSVLSRVYTEKKNFQGYEEGMELYVTMINDSTMPSELKMQTYTSFTLPQELLPDKDVVLSWLETCALKRLNIACYFIAAYDLEIPYYSEILNNRALNRMFMRITDADTTIYYFQQIIRHEKKEVITGAIRQLQNGKRHFTYQKKNVIFQFSEEIFASKEVFFTTKLLFCMAFDIPKEALPHGKDLYKILKISINYEERITKDFIKKYNLDFDCSDLALCRYYLGNKKAMKEKTLVNRFAGHLIRIPNGREKDKLLQGAFKRGGMFRMYAGCMRDGFVDEGKQRHFHYSEEDIEWVKTLPGLVTNSEEKDEKTP